MDAGGQLIQTGFHSLVTPSAFPRFSLVVFLLRFSIFPIEAQQVGSSFFPAGHLAARQGLQQKSKYALGEDNEDTLENKQAPTRGGSGPGLRNADRIGVGVCGAGRSSGGNDCRAVGYSSMLRPDQPYGSSDRTDNVNTSDCDLER